MPRSTQDVSSDLQELRNLQLENIAFDDLRNRISQSISGYGVKSVLLPHGAMIFRARNNCRNLPLHVSEIQHPPKELVIDFSRANRPGQSVFYCTTDWNTQFWELRAQVGQLMVLSTWVTKRDLRLLLIGYTPTALAQLGTERRFDNRDKSMHLDAAANEAIHEFLASEFTKTISPEEKHLYKMPAAIASLSLERLTK